MSGPIVRSGPSSTYTEKWDSVFGGNQSKSTKEAKRQGTAKKTAKKKK